MKVEWQVFSSREKRVIYTTSTEGYSSLDEFREDDDVDLYGDAFGNAVKNLLAEEGFHKHLMREQPAY